MSSLFPVLGVSEDLSEPMSTWHLLNKWGVFTKKHHIS